MPLSADDLELVMSIPGSTDEEELSLLFDLARSASEGCIVEVGSAKGRSTVALALGARSGHGVPVFAIEPHEHFDGVLGGRFTPGNRTLFFESLLKSGTAETIRLVNLSSEVVSPGWSQPVAVAFIDGDHRYEGVLRDYRCWSPFVIDGGAIVFHDSVDPALGPRQVVREAVASGDYVNVEVVSRATVLRKSGTGGGDSKPD